MSNSRSPLIQGNLNFFKPKEQTSFANVSNGIATDSPYNNYPFGNVFPEDDKDVYSQGGYREGNESVNNALNNIINLRGNLQNAQNASDVATAKAKVDNEARAKADKAKKIAELQKWLAEHKDEYLTAKKWIARFNDPIFQGLNQKGIDSGDFSGASNYVQQQDDKEAEKKRKKSDMNTVIKHYNDANYRLKVAENAPDANRDITREDLKFVNEVIGELEDAEQTDLAQQLRERLEGVEKLVLAGKQGEANEKAKDEKTKAVTTAFKTVMGEIKAMGNTTWNKKKQLAEKWLIENIGEGDIEAVKSNTPDWKTVSDNASKERTTPPPPPKKKLKRPPSK